MFRQILVGLVVASTWIGASAVSAQTQEDIDAQYREIVQARTQMERARQELEQAARVIATQAIVPVQDRSGSTALNNFRWSDSFFAGQGRLGVTIVDADGGALVTNMSAGSGAEEAGVRVGDVIQSINGVDLTGGDSPSVRLRDILGDVEPGATVALVVERAGQTRELEVETAEAPGWFRSFSDGEHTVTLLAPPSAPGSAPALHVDRLGDFGNLRALGFARSPWAEMELVAVTEELGRYFDTSEGLLVVSGPEDDGIDIQDGDVILAISGRVPNSPEHAIRILSSFEGGETVELSIMRDGSRLEIEYAVPQAAGGALSAEVPAVSTPAAVQPSPD